jgi:hypothetical protein
MIYEIWNKPGGIISSCEVEDGHGERLRGLFASVGAAPDCEYYENTINLSETQPAKWKGYRLEVLGIVVGRYSQIGIPIDPALRMKEDTYCLIRQFPYPIFSPPEYPDYIIRPCRLRAYYEGVEFFAERILYGDDEGIAIRFPIPKLSARPRKTEWEEEIPPGSPLPKHVTKHSDKIEFKSWQFDSQFLNKDLKRILKGLDLLRGDVKKFGRAEGTRTYSESDFFEAAVEAYLKCYEKYYKRPSDHDVAGEMELSKSAFNNHKKDYGVRQSDIRAEAMRRINKR